METPRRDRPGRILPGRRNPCRTVRRSWRKQLASVTTDEARASSAGDGFVHGPRIASIRCILIGPSRFRRLGSSPFSPVRSLQSLYFEELLGQGQKRPRSTHRRTPSNEGGRRVSRKKRRGGSWPRSQPSANGSVRQTELHACLPVACRRLPNEKAALVLGDGRPFACNVDQPMHNRNL